MRSKYSMTVEQQEPAIEQTRPAYSIIIPAYNEEARVGATLERVLSYAAEQGWDAEVIAVNDGSSDNTTEIVRGYAEKDPRLRLLENPGNRGKGYSVRNGMLHARGEILLFSDADFRLPSKKRANFLLRWKTGLTSQSAPGGCNGTRKRRGNPFTANFSDASSTFYCASSSVLSSKIHSVDLKRLTEPPQKQFSRFNTSNDGALIPNCSFWQTSSTLKWRRFPSHGPIARAHASIPFAMAPRCLWKCLEFAGTQQPGNTRVEDSHRVPALPSRSNSQSLITPFSDYPTSTNSSAGSGAAMRGRGIAFLLRRTRRFRIGCSTA